eukprot:PhM_4_TR18843/c0_g2_i4/m.100306
MTNNSLVNLHIRTINALALCSGEELDAAQTTLLERLAAIGEDLAETRSDTISRTIASSESDVPTIRGTAPSSSPTTSLDSYPHPPTSDNVISSEMVPVVPEGCSDVPSKQQHHSKEKCSSVQSSSHATITWEYHPAVATASSRLACGDLSLVVVPSLPSVYNSVPFIGGQRWYAFVKRRWAIALFVLLSVVTIILQSNLLMDGLLLHGVGSIVCCFLFIIPVTSYSPTKLKLVMRTIDFWYLTISTLLYHCMYIYMYGEYYDDGLLPYFIPPYILQVTAGCFFSFGADAAPQSRHTRSWILLLVAVDSGYHVFRLLPRLLSLFFNDTYKAILLSPTDIGIITTTPQSVLVSLMIGVFF